MAKAVIVYHIYYGCDTGCCGHRIEMGEQEGFTFSHPYGDDHLKWAQDLVVEEFGEEHVADLDWKNCDIQDD